MESRFATTIAGLSKGAVFGPSEAGAPEFRWAEWRCSSCGQLLLKHGPNPGMLEIRCPRRTCKAMNRRGPDC